MDDRKRLDDATKREIAVKASVCPRTVEKAARGEPVRGLAGHRVRETLIALGYLSGRERDEE